MKAVEHETNYENATMANANSKKYATRQISQNGNVTLSGWKSINREQIKHPLQIQPKASSIPGATSLIQAQAQHHPRILQNPRRKLPSAFVPVQTLSGHFKQDRYTHAPLFHDSDAVGLAFRSLSPEQLWSPGGCTTAYCNCPRYALHRCKRWAAALQVVTCMPSNAKHMPGSDDHKISRHRPRSA